MPKIPQQSLMDKRKAIAAMDGEYQTWSAHLQDLAKYILPRRYIWLASSASAIAAATENPMVHGGNTRTNTGGKRNEYILDGTGTKAARTLAAGLMNGVTSPARPWFRLRLAGFDDDETSVPVQRYLDEVQRRMLLVMAESNFYNAMAIVYLELVVFGTAACLIYEDFQDIVRCYNCAMGEFRISQDDRKTVDAISRTLTMSVKQLVTRWGEDNVSPAVLAKWKAGGSQHYEQRTILHLIEPNDQGRPESIGTQFAYREFFWESDRTDGNVLAINGFREKPGIFARWELVGNDSYGTSPAMDALPDIIQLQHQTKRKAQGIDKQVSPPMVADIALQNQPTALFPNGISYVPSSSQVGLKPAYTSNLHLGDLLNDMHSTQERIKDTFHNPLFQMFSDLSTVRSATEIDARREEKLVMLGAVLERIENEALDPAVARYYAILKRKNLLPEPPPGYEDLEIEVQYVSVLSDAQRAVGTASMERFMEIVGNLAGVTPDVLGIPDFNELLREYAARLNLPAVAIKPREQVQAETEAKQEEEAMQSGAVMGNELTQAAKNLSDTDVGGGANAMQMLMGA